MKALLIDRKTKEVLSIIEVEDVAHLELISVGDCIKVMQDDIAKDVQVEVGDDVGLLLDKAAELAEQSGEPGFMRLLRAIGIKG